MLTLDDFDTPWHSPYARYICGGPGAAAVAPILASSPKCGTASNWIQVCGATSGLASCVFRWLLLPGKVGINYDSFDITFDLTFATSPLSHTVVNSTTTFDCFKMMLKPFRIRCLYDSSPGVVQLTTVQYDCEPLQPFLLSSLFSSSL